MDLPLSVRTIREEHASLTAVLHSLRTLVAEGPGDASPAFFDVVRAMLFYIDEFPERQHHPKESEYLFARLAPRVPALRPVLERLDAEHRSGEAEVRELQHRLLAWELLGESRRPAFADLLLRYVDFYLEHLRTEETLVLPAALEHLTPEDWAAADAAFAGHRSPLAPAGTRDPTYDRLFTRIMMRAPGRRPASGGSAQAGPGARVPVYAARLG